MNARWRSIASMFSRRDYAAHKRLSEAYRAVFQGSPSREDQEIVLADLQAKSGYKMISVPASDFGNNDIWFAEGKRALFATIFSHLTLAPSDIEALDNAARREAAMAANQENNF